MTGFRADYVPGWDCHGLPIETQVEKELKEEKADPVEDGVRSYCRAYAERFIDIQREEFKRLGGIGDWDHPYVTMDYDYQATIIEEIAEVLRAGRGLPEKEARLLVHQLPDGPGRGGDRVRDEEILLHLRQISPCERRTAFFMAIPESRSSCSSGPPPRGRCPANLAIAINPDFNYVAVETKDEIYIVIEGLVEDMMKKAGIAEYRIIGEISPEALKGMSFRHPFIDRPIGRGLCRLRGQRRGYRRGPHRPRPRRGGL